MIVFVRESFGGDDDDDGDLSLSLFFSLEEPGDDLDGGGVGCAGNVDSRKSCLFFFMAVLSVAVIQMRCGKL